MLVIITAIIGFLTSTLPTILRFAEVRMRLKHELQLAALKLEAAIRNVDATKEIAKAQEAVADTISARASDTASGGWLIEFIRAMIRPFITLSFVFLYLGFKIMTFFILVQEGINIDNMEAAAKIILDDTTISILMIVIGFYFGSRSILNQSK